MRGSPLLFAIAFIAQPAFADPPMPAPIAEANSGKMQCYSPNVAKKTCQSLGIYKPGKGVIDNIAIVLVAPQPLVVMETVSPVAVKKGKVCGPLRAEDIDASKITADGKAVESQQATAIRQQLKAALKDMLGREVCTAYLPKDGMLLARASLGGVEKPELDQKVIWVSPADGYKIGP
jgi:hypothetical protein